MSTGAPVKDVVFRLARPLYRFIRRCLERECVWAGRRWLVQPYLLSANCRWQRTASNVCCLKHNLIYPHRPSLSLSLGLSQPAVVLATFSVWSARLRMAACVPVENGSEDGKGLTGITTFYVRRCALCGNIGGQYDRSRTTWRKWKCGKAMSGRYAFGRLSRPTGAKEDQDFDSKDDAQRMKRAVFDVACYSINGFSELNRRPDRILSYF